jgi:hypothetical protein
MNAREMAMLKYANDKGITLDKVKADLAKVAMTLQAQRELAAAASGVDLHKHHNPQPKDDKGNPKQKRLAGPAKPIAQLPGRAADGQAFTQSNEENQNDDLVS